MLTTAGEVNLKVPKLRLAPFETAIIERYKRRESSVEESLIEMYLGGVSVRRLEDVTEMHWRSIRTNNIHERLNRKIRRRTRVVGCFAETASVRMGKYASLFSNHSPCGDFPNGELALMLVCARLRYIASKDWWTKRNLNMKHLYDLENQKEMDKETRNKKDVVA